MKGFHFSPQTNFFNNHVQNFEDGSRNCMSVYGRITEEIKQISTFFNKGSLHGWLQAYIKKELGKVVVYTTTSGIVRKTFYNCKKVKQILRTHMVKYDELDLFGDAELQTELRDRLGSTVIQLPQLFIDGQHIGVSKFITCIYSYNLTYIGGYLIFFLIL